MFFTGENLPLPHRPFPFDFSAQVLPARVPDCHLVRTVIPCLPFSDSLGDFHDKTYHSLSLFCKHGFQERYRQSRGHHDRPRVPLSPHVHSRQATLHAATRFCALLCRFILDSYAIGPRTGAYAVVAQGSSLHGNRVVCAMPLARARNP